MSQRWLQQRHEKRVVDSLGKNLEPGARHILVSNGKSSRLSDVCPLLRYLGTPITSNPLCGTT